MDHAPRDLVVAILDDVQADDAVRTAEDPDGTLDHRARLCGGNAAWRYEILRHKVSSPSARSRLIADVLDTRRSPGAAGPGPSAVEPLVTR